MKVQYTLVIVAACIVVCGYATAPTPRIAAGEWQGRVNRINEWRVHEDRHTEGSGLQTTTYVSPPLNLKYGEVIFTDPNDTPLQFPTGDFDYAITDFRAEIVDSNNVSTPLSEVYNHHWLVFRANEGNQGVCGGYLDYMFGVGAESRRTADIFPRPYAIYASGKDQWFANIHVLRTVHVPDVKACIECHCPEGGGAFRCCPDGSFCPTDGTPTDVKMYYLRYTVNWTRLDTPLGKSLQPLDIYVLDASNCEIEYNVPQCASKSPDCVNTRSHAFNAPKDLDVVLSVGHVHIGGINLTTYIGNDTTDPPLCTNYPIYGNGTEAGNEKGYVVKMTTCTFEQPVHIKKGTPMLVQANYHSDIHYDAVMGLVYIAAIRH